MAQRTFQDIPFGPLLRDLQGAPNPANPGYLVDSTGLRPTTTGYRPLPQFANITNTTAVPAGTVSGRVYAAEVNGTVSIFACTTTSGPINTRLYQTNDLGVSWSNVEGASGAPGLFADFCQFDNLVIAGSRARVPQSKDLFAAVGTAFADLAGSPPTGATIARVRDHVVIGNLTSASLDRYAVRWGAIGDPTDWPTPGTSDARSKQAGIQYLPMELGQVTKIVGGEKFGLIVQERGLTRMTYVGGASVFEFDTFEKRFGGGDIVNDIADSVIQPHAVVSIPGGLFAWFNPAAGGLFVTEGYSVRNVAVGKLEEYLTSGSNVTSSAYDDVHKAAFFYNSGIDHLIYRPDLDQFSWHATASLSSIAECPFSAGARRVIALNTSQTLQRMNSATEQTVELQTGFIELVPGHRAHLTGVELIGSGTPLNLVLEAKAVSLFEDINMNPTGFTTLTENTQTSIYHSRLNGRYFAFRVTGSPTSTDQVLRGLRIYYARGEEL